MAKGGHKRKRALEETSRETPSARAAPRSLLQLALRAYEAGDMVLARRAARKVLDSPATLDGDASPTAKDVAREILTRTEVPPRAYLFTGVTLAIISLMVLLAIAR